MKQAAGLLAVDIDGTLITDHGCITDKVYDSLEKAVSLNWVVVVASGRTFHAAKPVIEKLPFLEYAVLSNGACIIHVKDMNVVHIEKLRPSLIQEVIGIARDHHTIPALYTSDVKNQNIYYDTLEGACEFFVWYVNNDPRSVRVENISNHIEDIMQVSLVAEKEVIFSVKEALPEVDATVMILPFESSHFGGKSSDFWFMQVVSRKARKNNALNKIAELLNIPKGRLVAVGDNYNDSDMIDGADIGVAMGNAPDEIKKLAKVIVASNNHSGLAQVVDEVIISGKYFS